jgi:hypothetical protein
MLTERHKRLLGWIGSAAGTIGIVFVIVKLVEFSNQLPVNQLDMMKWAALLGLAILYGASGVLLAFAWRELLAYLGETVRGLWAVRTYGVSQLAKYIPGNIIHLAGRQAIGVGAGLPNLPLIKSAIWEHVTIVSVGAIFGSLLLPSFTQIPAALAAIIFAAVLAACTWIAARRFASHLAWAVVFQAGFLAAAGLTFFCILILVAPDNLISARIAILVCGAYVVATVAGIVTPGAPAGLGVREVALYALLHVEFSEPDLLIAIFFSRVITVAGDAFFYFVAALLPKGPASDMDPSGRH